MQKMQKLTVEDAIDDILGEETVGDFGPNKEFLGNTSKLTDTGADKKVKKVQDQRGSQYDYTINKDLDEDSEEASNYWGEKILSLFDELLDGKELSINDIVEMIGVSHKRDIMLALQDYSNAGKLSIDKNNIVRRTFDEDEEAHMEMTEAAEDVDDLEPDSKIHSIIDDILDGENNLEGDILEVLGNSASGSVSGLTPSEIVRQVRYKNTSYKKHAVMETLKQLLSDKKIVKGPGGKTLIVNSSDEDEEIPTGMIKSPSSTQTQENQALTNGETKDTLKAKGWKENTPGIFTSPDGKEKFAVTAESRELKLNKIMNKTYKDDEFYALCEEVDQAIDEIESGYTSEEPDTEGLDELGDTAGEEGEGEDYEYTIQLTADEYELFKGIAEKILDAGAGAEEDYVSDDATDEEANADLMNGTDSDTDDLDFDDNEDSEEEDEKCPSCGKKKCVCGEDSEEDSEEGLDDGGNGVHDGSFSNGAPSLTKQTPSYGSNRRAPITSKHFNPKSGTAYDGAHNAGAPKLQKQTPEYKSKSGKPVSSKNTASAGTQKSLFEW